jgi:hypothetical protein
MSAIFLRIAYQEYCSVPSTSVCYHKEDNKQNTQGVTAFQEIFDSVLQQTDIFLLEFYSSECGTIGKCQSDSLDMNGPRFQDSEQSQQQ